MVGLATTKMISGTKMPPLSLTRMQHCHIANETQKSKQEKLSSSKQSHLIWRRIGIGIGIRFWRWRWFTKAMITDATMMARDRWNKSDLLRMTNIQVKKGGRFFDDQKKYWTSTSKSSRSEKYKWQRKGILYICIKPKEMTPPTTTMLPPTRKERQRGRREERPDDDDDKKMLGRRRWSVHFIRTILINIASDKAPSATHRTLSVKGPGGKKWYATTKEAIRRIRQKRLSSSPATQNPKWAHMLLWQVKTTTTTTTRYSPTRKQAENITTNNKWRNKVTKI